MESPNGLPIRMTVTEDDWFVRYSTSTEISTRLFCFGYAGSAPSIFKDWPADLPTSVEVCAAQLPARGPRMMDALTPDFDVLVDYLLEAAEPLLDRPCAFFGHCMGNLLAFELSRAVAAARLRGPSALIVSAFFAPHIQQPQSKVIQLSDDDVVEFARKLDGTPEEVLQDEGLQHLVLPTLRADIKLLGAYGYRQGPPLDAQIVGIAGDRDDLIEPSEVERWSEQTTGSFQMHLVPGTHFYIHTHRDGVLRIVDSVLRKSVV